MAAAIRKRVESFFTRQRVEIESPFFMRNGGELMEKLISLSDKRDEIQIRRLSIQEIKESTNNFGELATNRGEYKFFKGNLEGRPILVEFWTGIRRNHGSVVFGTSISAKMCHLKNVLKLIGCCLDMEYPVIVYEYARIRTLSGYLREDPELTSSFGSRIKIAREIASMLVYLHTCFPMPIIHRDINPWTVMIDEDGVAKLLDFTLAIQLPKGKSKLDVQLIEGTSSFLPPEYSMTGVVSTKLDVYLLGMLLFLILVGNNTIAIHQDDIINFFDEVERIRAHVEQFTNIDPKISYEVGIDEFQATKDLVLLCTKKSGDESEEMTEVARRLHQIERDIGIDEFKATKDLVLSCTRKSGYERPEMIEVARRLHQIEKAIKKSSPGKT